MNAKALQGAGSSGACAPAPQHPRVVAGRSILVTMLTNGCTTVLAVGTSAILARTLGPEGRGQYAAIISWASVAGVVGQLGVNYAVPCAIAAHPASARAMARAGVVVSMAAAVLVGAVAWAALPFLLPAQAPEVVATARLAVPAIAGGLALYAACLAMLQGLARFASWNAVRLAQGMLWLLLLAACAGAGLRTARAYAWANAAGYVLMVPVIVFLALRFTSSGRERANATTHVLRLAVPSWLASLPQMLNRRLDQLVLAAVAAPSVLGLYAVAASVASLLGTLLSAVANVAVPHLAGLGEGIGRTKVAATYIRGTILVASIAGLALLLGAPAFIAVAFGRRFLPAIPVALILIISGVLDAIARVAEDALIGLGRPRKVLRTELLSAAVLVPALALLVPFSPLFGTAVAVTLSMTTAAFVAIRELRATGGATWSEFVLPRRTEVEAIVRSFRSALPGINRRSRTDVAGGPA